MRTSKVFIIFSLSVLISFFIMGKQNFKSSQSKDIFEKRFSHQMTANSTFKRDLSRNPIFSKKENHKKRSYLNQKYNDSSKQINHKPSNNNSLNEVKEKLKEKLNIPRNVNLQIVQEIRNGKKGYRIDIFHNERDLI